MHAGAGRVQHEFADRDAHAVAPQIAEAEDAFAIGHHDYAHIPLRPVAQYLRHAAPIFRGNVEPARAAENSIILLARLADRGRVDDRHHLLDMIDQDAVKERLVSSGQRDERDVAFQVRRFARQIAEHSLDLLGLRLGVRRQQTAQAKRIAFGGGECAPFIQNRIVEQLRSARDDLLGHLCNGAVKFTLPLTIRTLRGRGVSSSAWRNMRNLSRTMRSGPGMPLLAALTARN